MKKKWGKRFLSLLLAGVMTVSSVCTSYATEVNPGAASSKTDGAIVAGSYSELSEIEAAILANAGVTGETLEFIAPSDSTDLVTVDAENKTVTAADYTDGKSNVWKPVEAYVVEGTASAQKIDGFANGSGNFGTLVTTENYTIQVKYQLTKTISADAQQSLLNTPYYLVTAVKDFEQLAAKKDSFKEFMATNDVYASTGYGNNILQLLKALADGVFYNLDGYVMTIKIKDDDAVVQAINDLYAETANGTTDLAIYDYIEDYVQSDAEGKKAEYVFGASGSAAAVQAKDTYDKLNTICESTGIEKLLSGADMLGITAVVTAINSMLKDVKTLRDAIAPTIVEDVANTAGLMSDITNSKMSTLITLALATEGSFALHNNVAINETLVVAETTLLSNVNRHDVTVIVEANVIGRDTVDSTAVETLTKSIVLQIKDGATDAELMQAIADCGIEAEALAAWTDYEVNTTNYTRTTNEPSSVTGDTEVVISYNPVMVTITEVDETAGTSATTDVPYGYNFTFEKHADSEKSYDYAVDDSGFIYQEGKVERITKDTTITRREGKKKTTDRLLNVLAEDKNYQFTDKAIAILENEAVKSDDVAFRAPDNNDAAALIQMAITGEAGNEVYNVTANGYESGVAGMVWQPASLTVHYDNNTTAEKAIGETFSVDGVAKVVVNYELKITKRDNGDTAGLSDAEVLAYANLPYELVEDAKAQLTVMNTLFAQSDNLSNGPLIKTLLNGLEGISDEARVAIDNLVAGAFAGTNLKVYTLIQSAGENPADGGLSVYYANYEELQRQIELLIANLPAVLDEQAFKDLIMAQKPEYYDKLGEVMTKLEGIEFVEPHAAIDMTASTSARTTLFEALKNTGLNEVTKYNASKGLTVTTPVEKAAEGRVTYVFQLEVYGSNGNLVKSYTSEGVVFDKDKELTADDIAKLQVAKDAMLANVANAKYYEGEDFTLPAVGTVVSRNTTLTTTWSPKTYVVTLDGAEHARITIDNNTITLPAAAAGYKYTYYIGSEAIEVASAAAEYVFTTAKIDALFGANNTLDITRTMVNVSVEEVKDFADTVNSGLASAGMTDSKIILLESTSNAGELAMVMRLDSNELSANPTGLVTSFAMAMLNESLVKMNGEVFYDANDGLYIQTLIDAITESGIGMESLLDTISKNGTLNQLELDGYNVLGNAARAAVKLGGQLIEIELELSGSTMPLYITLGDAEMAKVRKGIETLKPWVNVNTNTADGRVYVEIDDKTANETIFELLLIGLLPLEEYNTLADISDVDLNALISYVKTEFGDVVNDPAFSSATLQNTLDEVGADVDLSKYAAIIDKVLDLKEKLGITLTEENTSATPSYQYNATASIAVNNTLLSMLKVPTELSGLIKDTDLHVSFTLESVDIRENEYEALIIDTTKSKTEMINMVSDAATAIAKANKNAVVVLLDDVVGDITINNDIILSLNGKTVDGSVINKASEAVIIIDNDLTQSGSVTGALTGKFTATSGTYGTITDDQIAGGYILNGNTVKNAVYSLVKDANGNFIVEVDATFIENATETDLKQFAVDLGVKLALNSFTWASLSVSGGKIYDVNFDDLASSAADVLSGDYKTIVNDVIDLFDLDGIRNFANKVIVDFTSFGDIATAIENNTELATYAISTNPWDLLVSIKGQGADNKVAVGIGSNQAATKNAAIKIYATGTDSQKKSAADLLKELDKIVTKKVIQLDSLKDINFVADSINKNTLTSPSALMAAFEIVDAHATIDVEIDLTQDDRYTTIIGAVLASQNLSNTALVNGVKNWVNNGEVDGLKTAVEKLTVAQIIASLKNSRNVSFATMMNKLGLQDTANAAELEAVYHAYLNAAYAVLIKLDITGNNSKLPKTSEYGVYGKSATNWNKMDITLMLKLFKEQAVEPTIDLNINPSNIAFNGWNIDGDYIYLDLANVDGITTDAFEANALVTAANYDTTKVEYTGLAASGLIATGTKVTATATNAVGTATSEYTIVILGDLNSNGKVDLADSTLMLQNIVESVTLSDIQLRAADINCNGNKKEVADSSAALRKMVQLPVDPVSGKLSFLPYAKEN